MVINYIYSSLHALYTRSSFWKDSMPPGQSGSLLIPQEHYSLPLEVFCDPLKLEEVPSLVILEYPVLTSDTT